MKRILIAVLAALALGLLPAGAGATSVHTAAADTTAPAPPQLLSVPSSPTNQKRPTFVFGGEPGATFQCAITGGVDGGVKMEPCSNPFVPERDIEPGERLIRVTQTDAAGNVSDEAWYIFFADFTAPEEPEIFGPVGDTNDASPNYRFVLNGEIGATFRCGFDLQQLVACNGGEFSPSAPLSEGVHSFHIQPTDAAGNVGGNYSIYLKVDVTVPAAPAIASGPLTATNQVRPTFTYSGEAGTDFACWIDGDTPAWCPGGSFTPVAPLSEGPHTFTVTQRDAAMNVSAESTRSFTVDLSAPLMPEITAGPERVSADATPTFAFIGEEGASFFCGIDGKKPSVCDDGVFTSPVALGLGAHVFRVHQVDAAGNVSPDALREFTYAVSVAPPSEGTDAPPPSGPGPAIQLPARDTTPPDTKVVGSTRLLKFKLISTEAGSSFQCKVDGKPFRACKPKIKVKQLKGGKHTLAVRAVDAAGNVDPTPAKKRFRVGGSTRRGSR